MLNLYRYIAYALIVFTLTACGSAQPAEAAQKAQSIQFLLSQVRASGVALSGGKVDFYEAGATTTRKTVWLDRNKATAAANPYTLDSNGTAQLYGDGLYRIVIKDSAGVTKYDRDYISIKEVAGNVYDVADYTSLAAAVASIGSTKATLQFATDQTLTSNVTIPANIDLVPVNGAKIIRGAYTITGLKRTTPEMFGAVSGDGVDDGGAFEAAINSLRAGGEFVAGNGTYLLNTQITGLTDDITINLGSSILLNTATIPATVWEGQTINPVFKINANRVTVLNGHFKDFVSQGVFSGGALATHKNGFTIRGTRFTNLDDVAEVSESKCVQVRHVDNVVVDGTISTDIGHTIATHYACPISVNYSNGAVINNNTVLNDYEGGALNLLTVTKAVVTGNTFTGISNTLGGQACLAVHVKFGEDTTISGNTMSLSGSGTIIKISDGSVDTVISGNTMSSTGNYPNNYAGIYVQGGVGFNITGNSITVDGTRAIYVSPHIGISPAKKGLITGNYIEANHTSGTYGVKGSGIEGNGGNIGDPRGPLVISNNYLHNADIYLFQHLGAVVDNNTLYTDIDLTPVALALGGGAIFDTSCQIFIENGSYNQVQNNTIINLTAAPAANRTGIRTVATSYTMIEKNSVQFLAGTTLSYDYYIETSTVGMSYSNNSSAEAVNVNTTLVDSAYGTWTPTVTGATIVGTPTYTGKWSRSGRVVTFTLFITSTTSFASPDRTSCYFTLPVAPAASATGDSVLSAVNYGTNAEYGQNLIKDNNRAYLPAIAAGTNIVVTGSYFVW